MAGRPSPPVDGDGPLAESRRCTVATCRTWPVVAAPAGRTRGAGSPDRTRPSTPGDGARRTTAAAGPAAVGPVTVGSAAAGMTGGPETAGAVAGGAAGSGGTDADGAGGTDRWMRHGPDGGGRRTIGGGGDGSRDTGTTGGSARCTGIGRSSIGRRRCASTVPMRGSANLGSWCAGSEPRTSAVAAGVKGAESARRTGAAEIQAGAAGGFAGVTGRRRKNAMRAPPS
ncbi:hypothetical protein Aph02nite_77240 [Actinoplanes philippinensis]|nr:hypothetical protein Aph02nite_77240 [Actinoplanes philippinensis]